MKHKKNIHITLLTTCLLLVFFGLHSCADDEPSLDAQISSLNLQTLPPVTYPADNPTSAQKVELGRLLFWDPVLSGEKNITCATCHHPSLGYGDAIDISIGPGGTGLGTSRISDGRPPSTILSIRNSTSIVNSAYVGLKDANDVLDVTTAPLNWHINRRSLEAQAFGPLASQPHMRGNADYNANTVGEVLTNRVKAIQDYVALFDQAFNGSNGSGVTKDNIGKAIANFERSIVSNNSAYDQYVQGRRDALTTQQKRGLLLFYGKANCSSCHGGPMFSDFGLHNLGIRHNDKVPTPDKGNSENKYLFRTPSLRNVAQTAPFMHNGTIATLREVVEFYNKGVSQNPDINATDIAIAPLGLSAAEVDDITAFLHALTDDTIDKKIPASVPSGLPVGGS